MAKIDKPTDAGWEIPKNDLRASTPEVIEIDGVEYNTRICHVTKVTKWEARGWKMQKRFSMTDMVVMVHEKPQPEPEVKVVEPIEPIEPIEPDGVDTTPDGTNDEVEVVKKGVEIKLTKAEEDENAAFPTDKVKENTEA